ncbi:hypothetical protein FSP39_022681 [Pinctada imbricata]|uniref:oxaloacetate tautomerase n=1 Tax=Pinctada imbricata TaxID=66713 RepID=A0AA89C602_PINIB|nr:hypothetical protein FSP39_022681 [Pinctada imbricata]
MGRSLVKGVLFHQDNAPVHMSFTAMAAIHDCVFNLIDHLPYSPALAESDFHLFPKLKAAISGTHFQSDDDVILAVDGFLTSQDKEALAAEQGNPIPDKPIVFMKPTTSYITEGQAIQIPKASTCLFFEVELGVVINKTCKNVKSTDIDDFIGGFVLVLDMTAKDFQDEAKRKGQPWCLAKGFDTACPVSDFIEKHKVPDYNDIRLWLKVDGRIKQDSSTSDMIFCIPDVISYISQYMTLEEGDVVITGSPAGAGPVVAGEIIEAGLADIVSMKFRVESGGH